MATTLVRKSQMRGQIARSRPSRSFDLASSHHCQFSLKQLGIRYPTMWKLDPFSFISQQPFSDGVRLTILFWNMNADFIRTLNAKNALFKCSVVRAAKTKAVPRASTGIDSHTTWIRYWGAGQLPSVDTEGDRLDRLTPAALVVGHRIRDPGRMPPSILAATCLMAVTPRSRSRPGNSAGYPGTTSRTAWCGCGGRGSRPVRGRWRCGSGGRTLGGA